MTTTRLPFNIIDETFVHADDPAQPLTVQIEARVAGALDPDRLRAAVRSALARHPHARGRLEPWTDDALGYEWLIDDEPLVDPFRTVSGGGSVDLDQVRADFYSVPLSLFESPPLRVGHVPHPDGDLVMVSIHHSASDGMGALRLLQSIGRAYVDAEDPTPDFDPAQAWDAAVPESSPSLGDQLHSARMELQRLARLGSRPVRLTADEGSNRSGNGFRTLRLPLEPILVSPLRKEVGATVNDVLIAAASRAAGRWIQEHGSDPGRVSVYMPVNARPPEWSREMVANLVTGDNASTTAEERASAERCLSVVAGWTDAVKRRGPGPALAALNRIPRYRVAGRRAVTQWAMRAGSSLADTLVLSNVGRVPEGFVGGEGLEVTAVHFSPPAPMPAGLGLGAVAVGDHLTLTLRHRWALWSSAANDRFAELLSDEVDQLSAA